MGTRHLIAVQSGGEYKVAQYGQFDGYPSGQGVNILKFLYDAENISKLKKNLNRVRFIDDEKDKKFLDDYDKNCPMYMGDPETRTKEQLHWYNTYMKRNLSAEILYNIANSEDEEILLMNSIDFAADSLFCEWAYVIDLDQNVLEVYQGFNEEELGTEERFYGMTQKSINSVANKYYPVRLIGKYSLSNLQNVQDDFEKDRESELSISHIREDLT